LPKTSIESPAGIGGTDRRLFRPVGSGGSIDPNLGRGGEVASTACMAL
jgi:hypothetical protein